MEVYSTIGNINFIKMEKLDRINIPALDEILGNPIKVLDDGFIRIIDYMGSDESIVQAARVSYGKGTKRINEDKGLIRYLMRHNHTTPFEMCEIKLHVRVPMDCWRQWIRHRTANVNEYSTRYSIAIDSVHKTKKDEWRIQSEVNRQGSIGFLDNKIGSMLTDKEEILHKQIRENYEERIKINVAREQARKDLPLSTYTEAYWKIDLHNLFHFLELRMDINAQFEIRSYANIIGDEIVSKWCPLAWEAFKDYRINSFNLSDIEIRILGFLIQNNINDAKQYLISQKLIKVVDEKFQFNREMQEIVIKFKRIGLDINWNII